MAKRTAAAKTPKSKSSIDRQARTKVDGITRRLDRLESALRYPEQAIARLERLNDKLVDMEKRAASRALKNIGADLEEFRRYRGALEVIRAAGCICKVVAAPGTTLHADSPTMPLEGVDHLTSCHVAIAAKALGA